jgi:hypothetical protein
MKFRVVQFSPTYFYFLPLRSKYSVTSLFLTLYVLVFNLCVWCFNVKKFHILLPVFFFVTYKICRITVIISLYEFVSDYTTETVALTKSSN